MSYNFHDIRHYRTARGQGIILTMKKVVQIQLTRDVPVDPKYGLTTGVILTAIRAKNKIASTRMWYVYIQNEEISIMNDEAQEITIISDGTQEVEAKNG